MIYKDKLKKVISDIAIQLEELNQAEIKLEKEKATYSDIYYKQQLTEIKRAKQDLKVAAESKFNDYSKELNQAINEWATPKGSDIDDDIKLLNGSISLSQDEITSLGQKHSKNNTMTRAIKEYAGKNNMHFAVTSGDEAMRESQQLIDNHFKRAMNDMNSYSFKVLQADNTVDELTESFNLLEPKEKTDNKYTFDWDKK